MTARRYNECWALALLWPAMFYGMLRTTGSILPFGNMRKSKGMKIGTVHPNTFAGQEFRYGSLCSPVKEVREQSHKHFVDCVRIAREMGSKVIGMWVADGTNYPGQDNLRERKHRLYEGLKGAL